MPIVNFPEFEQFKSQGYKGTFVGGCIERGEGSSFRRKAHAHCFGQDKHMGWICVRSPKRLYNKAGGASFLMWHEMAHIITHDGHGRRFYMWLREHSTIRKDEERTSQWAYLCRTYKDPVRAYSKIKGRGIAMATKQAVAEVPQAVEAPTVDPITKLTGDPDAKRMGPAKSGGNWFKNYHTGKLYRIEKRGDALVLAETRESQQPASAEKKQASQIATGGTSRKELMEEARSRKIKYFRILSKSELMQTLDKETTPETLAKIQGEAIKRWKQSSKGNG